MKKLLLFIFILVMGYTAGIDDEGMGFVLILDFIIVTIITLWEADQERRQSGGK